MDDRISKELIVGWMITEVPRTNPKPGGPDVYVFTTAITVAYDTLGNDPDLEPGAKILAVLPAAPGSYGVFGNLPEGGDELLGYELPGVYCPDWSEYLDDLIVVKEEAKKREQAFQEYARRQLSGDVIYD